MEKMYPFGFHPAILHSDWLGNYLIFLLQGCGRGEKEKERETGKHMQSRGMDSNTYTALNSGTH